MSLGNFTAAIDAFDKRLQTRMDEFVRFVAFEIAAGLIVGSDVSGSPGTPIDTGFARGCWYVCFGDVQPSNAAVMLDSGQSALDQATLTLIGAKTGQIIYILNHAEYIKALEYGHSQQAPAGFVRITAASGQRIVDYVAKRMAA